MIDNFIEWMQTFDFEGMFDEAFEASEKRRIEREYAELEKDEEDND